MTVAFVPPRTMIRAAGPTTTITSTSDYMLDHEETDMYEEMDMDEMDEHGGGSLLTKKLVVPGQLVTDDPQFMRYHPLASYPHTREYRLTIQRTWDVCGRG